MIDSIRMCGRLYLLTTSQRRARTGSSKLASPDHCAVAYIRAFPRPAHAPVLWLLYPCECVRIILPVAGSKETDDNRPSGRRQNSTCGVGWLSAIWRRRAFSALAARPQKGGGARRFWTT